MQDEKRLIRKRALAAREALSPDEARAVAANAANAGLGLARKLCAPGAVVSGYWPVRGEVSTRPLMEALAQAGFRAALPVMTGAGRPLRFRAWSPGDELEKGPLGLSEPPPSAPEVEPECLFVPLVAFDARGGRIGYGGGNFDATLASLRARRMIVAIGLAFAAQEVDAIPAEPHDQRLDFVITEENIFDCGALR